MAWWCRGQDIGLVINRSSHSFDFHWMTLVNCSHLNDSVAKQYNLVLAKGWWCFAAGKVAVERQPNTILACTIASAQCHTKPAASRKTSSIYCLQQPNVNGGRGHRWCSWAWCSAVIHDLLQSFGVKLAESSGNLPPEVTRALISSSLYTHILGLWVYLFLINFLSSASL